MIFMTILLVIAIALGNPISIILILFAMHEDAEAADWEASERNKELRHRESEANLERRHREYMTELERHNRRSEIAKRRVRTMARDEKGRFIAQEVIEDYDDCEDE